MPSWMKHKMESRLPGEISIRSDMQIIPPYGRKTYLVAQMVKHLPTMQETQVQSLGWEDPLEKEMATHSSTLARKISWTEEHGRLQSRGHSQSDRTEQLHFLSLTAERKEELKGLWMKVKEE